MEQQLNIILQHYAGQMDELSKMSVANISSYAERIGASHRLILGQVFNSNISAQSQKLIMLDKQFDEYETVVMVDTDMFARSDENIFEASGMGRHTRIQSELVEKISARRPDLANSNAPYWGGAVYKFDQQTREQLRSAIPDQFTLNELDRMLKDESIIHYLAWKSGLAVTDQTYFSGKCGGEEWDMNSFDKPSEGNIIHIRPKWTLTGPKATKLEIYNDLLTKCVI